MLYKIILLLLTYLLLIDSKYEMLNMNIRVFATVEISLGATWCSCCCSAWCVRVVPIVGGIVHEYTRSSEVHRGTVNRWFRDV